MPDMLHRLVEKIVVKADGSENIHYKFAATAIIGKVFSDQ
jgi:site-specific DNA recombinase